MHASRRHARKVRMHGGTERGVLKGGTDDSLTGSYRAHSLKAIYWSTSMACNYKDMQCLTWWCGTASSSSLSSLADR